MNSSRTPLVSAIIPVYNAAAYLQEALASVEAQTYPNIEIIVIDDGSTDGSAEIAESFSPRIKLWRETHRGIGSTRNRGLERTSGELIAFLDADDLWQPRKTELQVARLLEDPSLDVVLGQMEHFLSPEASERLRDEVDYEQGRIEGVHPGAMLARRRAFERVGAFREDIAVGEFIDWFARLREMRLETASIAELVLKRRIHQMNTTRRVLNQKKHYLEVVKSALGRRRSKPSE